jgi:hypothetical protein
MGADIGYDGGEGRKGYGDKMTFMEFVVNAKQLLETAGITITTIAAADILLTELFKRLSGIRMKATPFFCGTSTLDGKRVGLFKGLKNQKEITKNIIKAIALDMDMEEVLVLDKKPYSIVYQSQAYFIQ